MLNTYNVYASAAALYCAVAMMVFVNSPHEFSFASLAYSQFLLVRWKVITFVVASAAFVVVAPYTGDPTWDYVDAFAMSILTFMTAPWSIGTLFLLLRRRTSWRQGWVAICFWMFSASWSYDLYLTLRDGHHPFTWIANLFASSVLYVAAGLFWNLDWRDGRGVTFSFLEDLWPHRAPHDSFRRIVGFAAPFMVLVACVIGYFFVNF